MGRIHTRPGQGTGSSNSDPDYLSGQQPLRFGSRWDRFLVRLVFAAACVISGYHFRPFGLAAWSAAALGMLFALAVFVFEMRLQRVSLRRLIGAAVGSILGILGAHLMGLVLARTSIPEGSRSFLDVALLLVMTYIGLVLGTSKGDMLNLQALGGLFGSERGSRRQPKI